MERNKISYLILFAILLSNIVYVSNYKFELHFVEQIVEENTLNELDSRTCNSLIKNKKIFRVCRKVVGILGRRRIGILSNQPVEKVTLSVLSTDGSGAKKYVAKSTCKCPTDLPIYITDGRYTNSIMVILQDRETQDTSEMTSQSVRNENSRTWLPGIQTLPFMRTLKSRKRIRKKLDNETNNLGLGLSANDYGGIGHDLGNVGDEGTDYGHTNIGNFDKD